MNQGSLFHPREELDAEEDIKAKEANAEHRFSFGRSQRKASREPCVLEDKFTIHTD